MSGSVTYDIASKYAPGLAHYFTPMNATVAQNTLYGAVSLENLNWLERSWAAYYIWMGNPVLATGMMSFFVHEIIYFGRAIPWLVVDAIPYFHQWKLQPGKSVSNAQIVKCARYVLLTHFTVEFPVIFAFHPICCYFGMATFEVPFTPLWKMAAQIAFFFVFEDMYHYWAHRALHWGPLYKHIHKLHHEFSAPIGLAAEYAHPAEVLILAQGTITGPFLYCLFRPDLHIFTVYLWITLRLFQAVDAHSGYDFPWSLRHFLPFWAGADHHDFHHQLSFAGSSDAFTNCYSTSFRWWDFVLGTDNKYHAFRSRVANAKEKDREAVKQREMDVIEKEGLRAERLAMMGLGQGGMEGVPRGKLD